VLRYTMQFGRFEGLREAIRPKLPQAAETTRNEKSVTRGGGCSLGRRRKNFLCSGQKRKPENGGMGKKDLEGHSRGASLGGKGYDSGGVGCDGDLGGGASANQLIGSTVGKIRGPV
jgi:hypothetical protein